MGDDRDLHPEQRRGHRRPEEVLVALVVGVRDERDDGRDELGAGRLDVDGGAVEPVEGHPVVVPRVVAGLELGLGDSGLEGDIPQAWRLGGVGLTAGEVAQEGLLRGRAGVVVDGAVGDAPVEREAHPPEERLEGLLVLDRQLVAQLDEVPARDRLLVGGLDARHVAVVRRDVALHIGQMGVAADAVVVLHPFLGR